MVMVSVVVSPLAVMLEVTSDSPFSEKLGVDDALWPDDLAIFAVHAEFALQRIGAFASTAERRTSRSITLMHGKRLTMDGC
jgi:hypothetical protein